MRSTFPFQPTLPLRGATSAPGRARLRAPGFNPRSPCGERRSPRDRICPYPGFNPRSPCGERPGNQCRPTTGAGFNPRSPCGERLEHRGPGDGIGGFQPTLPLRGATGSGLQRVDRLRVSTHAPLAGSDLSYGGQPLARPGFNPRSPCGERRDPCAWANAGPICFNPRSPCGERRWVPWISYDEDYVSTHAPLAGSDLVGRRGREPELVSTHAPLAGSDQAQG